MTAVATRLRNPLRPKALGYLRDNRLVIHFAGHAEGPGHPPETVSALISPAPGDPSGYSAWVKVELDGGVWTCDGHRDDEGVVVDVEACAHVYAVQLVTGHAHRGGRWRV